MMALIEERIPGLYTLDLGFLRPRFVSSHVIVSEGRVALVDVGSAINADRLFELLATLGFGPEQVDYVIVTHVHLDHAGGAGAVMARCPNATLVVHPSGARHMLDPAELIAGATAVYGEQEMRRSYGGIVPVASERVWVAEHDTQVDFAGRVLRMIDTPGHAYHHLSVLDEQTRSALVGDTFGTAYPEFQVQGRDFLFPATSPTQFNPQALHQSIDAVLATGVQQVFLTHFGMVPVRSESIADLHRRIDDHAKLAKPDVESTHQQLKEYCLDELRQHGVSLDEKRIWSAMALDIQINAQGLSYWAAKLARQ